MKVKTAIALAIGMAANGVFAQTLQADLTQPHSGEMVFSSILLASLSAASVVVSAVSPASATTSGTQVTGADAPLTSITLNAGNELSGATAVASSGGALMTAPSTAFGSGGSLSVTDLGLNATTGYVTANLSGANGQANLTDVPLFEINAGTYQINGGATQTYSSNAAVIAGLASTPGQIGTLTLAGQDLVLNPTYQSYFQDALGLNAVGLSVLTAITDYGTITITGTLKAVPETDTYVSIGLGLAGLGLLAQRRRRSNSATPV